MSLTGSFANRDIRVFHCRSSIGSYIIGHKLDRDIKSGDTETKLLSASLTFSEPSDVTVVSSSSLTESSINGLRTADLNLRQKITFSKNDARDMHKHNVGKKLTYPD